MTEDRNGRYQRLVEDVNSVARQHGLAWEDIQSLLQRYRAQSVTPVRSDVCGRVDKAGESVILHGKVPEDLDAFRLFVAQLNEALDLSLPLDAFQGTLSLAKKWGERAFAGAFFVFVTYMVMSGIFVGTPLSSQGSPPMVRLILLFVLMVLISLLEGSQISVAKAGMTDLENYPQYHRVHSVHKKLQTRQGSGKYYAGRQLCVFVLVFIAAQLTSFSDVHAWPFTGNVLPGWFETAWTRIFFQSGIAGALFVLWFGSLAPQLWADKDPIRFLNFWLTPNIIRLCWFVESLGLARPATWLTGWIKTAEKPPTSSKERYYQANENAGYTVNLQKRIWSLRAADAVLRTEVSYLFRRQGFGGMVDNSLFLNGKSLDVSFWQELICHNSAIARDVLACGCREVALDNGWRQFIREFQCDFGDFLPGDVVIAGSEARISHGVGRHDNVLVDMISVNVPTKCILFRLEFQDQPVRVGAAALQIYRSDFYTIDESPFVPSLRDPIMLMPKKTQNGAIVFEYSELYPAVGTRYVLSCNAEFLTNKSMNPKIEVLS